MDTNTESMAEFIVQSESEEETAKLGARLAAVLRPGSVVALNGTLGAGKTRLVQAIAEALGIDRRDVVSPTFVLLQEYHGPISLYHLDAYRINSDDEFWQLGIDEYYAAGGIVFIEWAERVSNCLPANCVEISIEVTGDTGRKFTIRGLENLAGASAIATE